jgi:hypothetical protein
MAYSTKIKNIFDQFDIILKDLPGGVYHGDFTGNEGISIGEITSTIVERMAGSNTRRYSVDMSVFYRANGTHDQVATMLSRRLDKLEYTLDQASSRTVSGTYYWHDGEVASGEISENDEGELIGNITYELSITEVA